MKKCIRVHASMASGWVRYPVSHDCICDQKNVGDSVNLFRKCAANEEDVGIAKKQKQA